MIAQPCNEADFTRRLRALDEGLEVKYAKADQAMSETEEAVEAFVEEVKKPDSRTRIALKAFSKTDLERELGEDRPKTSGMD